VRGEYRRCPASCSSARQVPPARAWPAGHRPAAGPRIRLRDGVPAAGSRAARPRPCLLHSIVDEEGQHLLAAEVPTDDHLSGPARSRSSRTSPRCSSVRGGVRARSHAFRAQALRDPQALREGGGRPSIFRKTFATCRSLSSNTAHLQGMRAPTRSRRCTRILTDPDVESALASCTSASARNTSRPGPLAHPYRYGRAQRRDHTPARQHQLDAGPRGALPVRGPRATTQEGALPVTRDGLSDSATFDNGSSSW